MDQLPQALSQVCRIRQGVLVQIGGGISGEIHYRDIDTIEAGTGHQPDINVAALGMGHYRLATRRRSIRRNIER